MSFSATEGKNTHILIHSVPAHVNGNHGLADSGVNVNTGLLYKGILVCSELKSVCAMGPGCCINTFALFSARFVSLQRHSSRFGHYHIHLSVSPLVWNCKCNQGCRLTISTHTAVRLLSKQKKKMAATHWSRGNWKLTLKRRENGENCHV